MLSEPLRCPAWGSGCVAGSVQTASVAVAAAGAPGRWRWVPTAALQRWPDDPASWQLQWDLAREAFWQADGMTPRHVARAPSPRSNCLRDRWRRLFWHGFSAFKPATTTTPSRQSSTGATLIARLASRGGYYRWRAMENRLSGTQPLALKRSPGSGSRPPSWTPLDSGDNLVDQLWRLGLVDEAWDAWQPRHRRRRIPTGTSCGRPSLRSRRGDTWMGLESTLEISLRWRNPTASTALSCITASIQNHFEAEFQEAAQASRSFLDLLRRSPPGITLCSCRGLPGRGRRA